MAARKKFDVVATVGKYTDRQSGEEKKRYMNVGSVFEQDDGRLSMKLDAVPVGQEWSGWLSFYEPKQRDNHAPAAAAKPAPVAATSQPDFDTDVPF